MPTHRITYTEHPTPAGLDPADRELLNQARAALEHAYAPYSEFRVGAAARLADGTVVTGWNTENAAYPMCLCAEPAALAAAAHQRPGTPVVALAVTVRAPRQTVDRPATPCGSCRQQLAEHESRFGTPIRLVLRGQTGPVWVFAAASELLPFGFSSEHL